MLDTTELKKGVRLEMEGKVFQIVKSDFTNPGKGSAFYKCKLRNLENGAVIERTFKSGVSTNAVAADLDDKIVEFMYKDMDGIHFMDQQTYETVTITEEQCGDAIGFLQEGIKLDLLYWQGKPISIDVPNFVELKVAQTDPGLKGDTAQGGTKKAVMETGLQVNVPLFIEEGELLKIDTRDGGSYVERVKN